MLEMQLIKMLFVLNWSFKMIKCKKRIIKSWKRISCSWSNRVKRHFSWTVQEKTKEKLFVSYSWNKSDWVGSKSKLWK